MTRLITEYEKTLRDNIAEEFLDLAGTLVTLYVLDRYDSVSGDETSILYGEPQTTGDWDMTAYTEVKAYIEKPETDLTTNEGGLIEAKAVQFHFAKGYIERECIPVPKQGDVIYHATFGYFDIVKVSKEGYYSDNSIDHFTSYACETERNERFTPDRKLN